MKIDIESRFASIVFMLLLFSAFYFYYVPEGANASDLKKHIFGVCFKINNDVFDVFLLSGGCKLCDYWLFYIVIGLLFVEV